MAGQLPAFQRKHSAPVALQPAGGDSVRAGMEGRGWLAEPLRLADEAHRLAPGLWIKLVDEEDSVEVIGLMLDATRQQIAAFDDDRFSVHIHALRHDAQGTLRVEGEPGK